jgi:hypothetical protein
MRPTPFGRTQHADHCSHDLTSITALLWMLYLSRSDSSLVFRSYRGPRFPHAQVEVMEKCQ